MSEARRMWAAPVVLGVLTASGLVSALVSDDLGDVWSWIGLGIPMAVLTWYAFAPRRARH